MTSDSVSVTSVELTEQARAAFQAQDLEASRAVHDARKGAVEVHASSSSDFLKSIVYGGLDGIITTFAIVASVAGAALQVELVLVLGLTNLVADGFSMGFGDYLSSKAELELLRRERKREEWEMENYPEGEQQEMIELYTKKGMSADDATSVIATFAKYKKMFIDLMMVEELNMNPYDEDDSPAMHGLVTFGSFLIFGCIPLIPYIPFAAQGGTTLDRDAFFLISAGMTCVTLFALGFIKGKVSRSAPLKSGVEMLFNGSIAAASAYLVGFAMEGLVHRGN